MSKETHVLVHCVLCELHCEHFVVCILYVQYMNCMHCLKSVALCAGCCGYCVVVRCILHTAGVALCAIHCEFLVYMGLLALC